MSRDWKPPHEMKVGSDEAALFNWDPEAYIAGTMIVICQDSDEPHRVCSHPSRQCRQPKWVRNGTGRWRLREMFDERKRLYELLAEAVNVIQNLDGCMGNPCLLDGGLAEGQCVACACRAALRSR